MKQEEQWDLDTDSTIICKRHIKKCKDNLETYRDNYKSKKSNKAILDYLIDVNTNEMREFEYIIAHIYYLEKQVKKLRNELKELKKNK